MDSPDAWQEDAPKRRAVQRVLWITLFLNLAVAAAKFFYGLFTHTASIQADGLHSFTDGMNNVVALVSVAIAHKPPDAEHPYGHRKYEIFAGGFIGLLLLSVAFGVLRDAYLRMVGQSELPEISGWAFAVLGGTLVVNLLVATYEARRGKALDSPILQSDSHHTRSDVFVTAGIIIAVFMTRAGYPIADQVAAAGVAIFIAVAGFQVLLSNLRFLADSALVDPGQILEAARSVEGVVSAHRVRSRGIPGHIYVDLHLHLPRDLNIVQAHAMTHRVEDAIKSKIGGVKDVTIHTEPANPGEEEA
jgi:cation diffusion facilitator family transporter